MARDDDVRERVLGATLPFHKRAARKGRKAARGARLEGQGAFDDLRDTFTEMVEDEEPRSFGEFLLEDDDRDGFYY